jgi:hypothetical protein
VTVDDALSLDARTAPGEIREVLELFKVMWLRWQGVANGILTVQNGLLMGVAYFFGLGPVALGFRILGKPAVDRSTPDSGGKSHWHRRDGKPMTMDRANRMF